MARNINLYKYVTRDDNGRINGFVENEFIKKIVKKDMITYLIRLNDICHTTVDFNLDGTPHKYNEDINLCISQLMNLRFNC